MLSDNARILMTARDGTSVGVAILVFPFAPPSIFAFARKLAVVVASVAAHTTVVSGRVPGAFEWPDGIQVRDVGLNLHYLKEIHPKWLSILLWIVKFIWVQVLLAWQILRLRREIDVVICSLGCYYQLPILMARVLGKKVVCAALGLDSLSASVNYGRLMAVLVSSLVRFNFSLSHAVVVESMRLGSYKDLLPFRSKLHNGAFFVEDLEHFAVRTPVQEREILVGYMGRLETQKGVMEFVHAIPLALEQRPDLKFLIIGTGGLDEALEETIGGKPWASQVTWLKWVEHDRIPDYLNRLKLIVIPSCSEGLPNLALEAMGCGTPVLASSVGGIPDLITDGETGFLLRDNSPAAIAEAMVRVVDNPRLESITQQARALIKREYSLGAATRRYQAIFRAVI
jgi:glycosyltransferase involved in cell wall biosynthesis